MMAALAQAPAGASLPTVGDTIWVQRTIALPAGATIRAGRLGRRGSGRAARARRGSPPAGTRPTSPIRSSSGARALPRSTWPARCCSGRRRRIDSLPPQPVTLQVASVLPRVPPDSTLAPQPRADFVPRTEPEPGAGPAAAHGGGTGAGAAALVVAPPRTRPSSAGAAAAAGQGAAVERWADAGESRAVASVATARLRGLDRRAHAGGAPGPRHRRPAPRGRRHGPTGRWPSWAMLLRSLDEARFGEAAFPDAVGLARWADELAPRPGAGGRVTFARPWLLLLLLGLVAVVVAPPPGRGAGRPVQRRLHSGGGRARGAGGWRCRRRSAR